MELSISQDGFVHYGDKVILVNPDHARGEEAGMFLEGDMCLCVSPDEVKAQLCDELEMPCGVSAVQTTVPTGRNTFTILRYRLSFRASQYPLGFVAKNLR